MSFVRPWTIRLGLKSLEVRSVCGTVPKLVVVACLIWRGGGVFGLQAATGKNYEVKAHPTIYLSIILFVTALFSLTGCALLVPTSRITFHVDDDVPSHVVAQCVREAAGELLREDVKPIAARQEQWVLETGHFDNPHVVGFSMRVRYNESTRVGKITMHAIGIYYGDLGAEDMAVKVQGEITKCARSKTPFREA